MKWSEDIEIIHKTRTIGYLKKEFFRTEYPLRVEIEITLKKKKGKQLSIDLEEIKDPICLSISGTIYERKTWIHTGQIEDILEEAKSNGWKKLFIDKEKLRKLLVIWKKWHLNDLRAGTRKQMEVINKWQKKMKKDNLSYEEECKVLKEKNLLIDRGYEYGTKWLYEPLPKEVIEFVRSF